MQENVSAISRFSDKLTLTTDLHRKPQKKSFIAATMINLTMRIALMLRG
jgi:hypothetical protein